MAGRLQGSSALVTGAARGIGEAITRRFAEEGARVIAADVREEQGNQLSDELGAAVRFRSLDVTDENAWRTLVEELRDDPVDILVNNAGAVVSFAPLHELEPPEWTQILNLNLTSVYLGMRFVIPLMVGAGGGVVINMSSIAGVVGTAVAPAYQAAKAGVRILTKNGAITYATQGIRVNSIHPGLIATPMVAEQPQWATDGFLAQTPMQRAGQALDVAHAAVYLASAEASFVTGAELYVDGGFLAQ
jgi:NAD(P)-dependent dehydrogenase (short-subunit alcohol dehydrogenase family)